MHNAVKTNHLRHDNMRQTEALIMDCCMTSCCANKTGDDHKTIYIS